MGARSLTAHVAGLLFVAMLGCGEPVPATEDGGRSDATELSCSRGSDCRTGQTCATYLEEPSVATCVRGAVPTQAVCMPACRGRCLVGPHTLLNPDDPPGIVGGLITIECGDAGPGD
jgi:hypothetical protein